MTEEQVLKPSHEEIAQLAYEYYCLRGDAPGCAEDDWMRAEETLCNQTPVEEKD